MVKLQKQIAYKYKGKPIYKYRINIPNEIIEQLGWDAGTELIITTKGNKLEIRKSK